MSDENRKLDLGDKPEEQEPKAASGWEYLAEGGRIRCVFSTSRELKMGTNSSRRHASKIYWFAEQKGAETFEIRRLNANNVPEGNPEYIPMHRLINDYTPEPAYYEEAVLPAMEKLEAIIRQGDKHRKNDRLYSAEMEYNRALDFEEKNVRALFGLGLIFLTRKEVQRTRDLLGELVELQGAYSGKNQHLFNEFGIALRKHGLFAEAVVYYSRGLEFTKNDEHLYYNLARAYYENGDWHNCLDNLIKSNRINPGLNVARDLFRVIVGLAEDEQLLRHYDKPPVPGEVVAKARNILAAETGKLKLDENPVRLETEREQEEKDEMSVNKGDPGAHLSNPYRIGSD